MTDGTTFLIPVATSPVAALLAAAGTAAWLEDLGTQITGDGFDVRIANVGHGLVVSSPTPLTPAQVQATHYVGPIPRWVHTAKNGPPPTGSNPIDYEAERQHNSAYYEMLKRMRKEGETIRGLSPEQQHDLEAQAPRDFWPVAAMINQMGAITTYNKAVERWMACRTIYPELAALVWTLWSGAPDAQAQAEHEWVRLAKKHGLDKSVELPATQIVNPEQGKGANRPKADALTIGGQASFWLLEYFKFAGLYHAALPRTVQGKKDRKTYVIVPSRDGIVWHWHGRLFTKFQKEFWAASAIKMDIQAALRYTAAMLETWEGAQYGTGRRLRPSDFVEASPSHRSRISAAPLQ